MAARSRTTVVAPVVAHGRTRAVAAVAAPVVSAWQPALRVQLATELVGGIRRLADLLEVAPSQPSRWATGESTPSPTQARLLVDLDHVLAHCSLVWGAPEVIRDWLGTANVHLDGLTPIAWLRRHGSAEVVAALRAEAAGAFA